MIRIRSMRVVAKRSFLLLNARFLQRGCWVRDCRERTSPGLWQ
ncbi:hypothetical protein RHOER0001_4677 [Rhodococcus erythropolis SK121]|nr:hypothetical protein RHOER0001_4677 [Rhodococcus erythropolis SK121]